MRAHTSADAGQRIGIASDAIGLFETALGNQADIASGIGVRRAGHHAGEVRVQPTPIDLFILISLQHAGTFRPRDCRTSTSLSGLRLTMKVQGASVDRSAAPRCCRFVTTYLLRVK